MPKSKICLASRLLIPGLALLIVSCAPNTPSNVLIIMLDDFGQHDMGSHFQSSSGANPQHTPELDAFAARATRFTRHYTESTCSPSRAALLSGRYPARSGFTSSGRGLSPELITLPEQLNSSGYRTHFVGKWHTGDTTELAHPDNQGFDTWLGFLNQWMLREAYDPLRNNLNQPTYIDPWLENERDEIQQYPGHLNDILTDEANRFIAQASTGSQPWFLQLSYYAPHVPFMPAERFASLYPDSDNGRYRALVQQLDSNVGRVLQALENNNVADNTIVVIVSDNGGLADSYPSNYPFNGVKGVYQEGGIRTPLMVHWPQSVANGAFNDREYSWAVSIMDLYPTILSALGISYDPEKLDGRNLLPLIASESKLERALHWETLTPEGYDFSVLDSQQRYRYSTGVLNSSWLYDLDNDPEGKQNILAQNSEQAASLNALHDEWHQRIHRIDTQYSRELENGGGVLTGDSLQRSPGFGGYTFAIGITTPLAEEDTEATVIASQRDLLSIYYESGALELNIQDVRLHAELPEDGQCHALIVSAQHNARVSWIIDRGAIDSPIQVIVDGQLNSGIVDHRELPKQADLTAPTYIGHRPNANGEPDMIFPGELSAPLILNQRLFINPGRGQYGVDTLQTELCP